MRFYPAFITYLSSGVSNMEKTSIFIVSMCNIYLYGYNILKVFLNVKENVVIEIVK